MVRMTETLTHTRETLMTYTRGARSNWSDEARFIGQAEAEAIAEAEAPIVTDALDWSGMYDGADTDTDMMSGEDFTYDPDDQYGTERY